MKITEVKPLAHFKLSLRFDNGASGIVDLNDMIGHGVLEAWNRSDVFEKVRITELGALEWPGAIDLCPDALYLRLTGKRAEDIFPVLRERAAHA
jgi:hypothetical protein